ncbi:hypothetical protein H5410_035557 [Solanum commersonii]|uniref:Uncharacterized protein n=1 Tax=Solanum commersonii TaxID=4109 RepID=A0A9J5Y280_SOLCO|nr:hypothetical protein H5410_035557 [Solanum commersonii]
MKWRLASGDLYDKKVECWPVKNFHVRKMQVVEINEDVDMDIGEDEGSKTRIIWACEEISRYPSEKVREARYSGYDER